MNLTWYECKECGHQFPMEHAEQRVVNLEEEYGVGGVFPDHHTGWIDCCPECDSEELDEISEPIEEEDPISDEEFGDVESLNLQPYRCELCQNTIHVMQPCEAAIKMYCFCCKERTNWKREA